MSRIPSSAVPRASAHSRFLSSSNTFLPRSLYRSSPSMGVFFPESGTDTSAESPPTFRLIKPSQFTQSTTLESPTRLRVVISISRAHTVPLSPPCPPAAPRSVCALLRSQVGEGIARRARCVPGSSLLRCSWKCLVHLTTLPLIHQHLEHSYQPARPVYAHWCSTDTAGVSARDNFRSVRQSATNPRVCMCVRVCSWGITTH